MTHVVLPADSGFNFTEGLDQLFFYTASQVPIFLPMVLFGLFMVVMLGGFFTQQRQTGKGDITMWMAIGGYITTGAAFILSLIEGLLSLQTVIIILVITIFLTTLYLLSRDRV